MNIAVTGKTQKIEELEARISSACKLIEFAHADKVPDCELIIDLDFDNRPGSMEHLLKAGVPLLLSAVKIQLAAVIASTGYKPSVPVFGFNALPGFINRDLAEVSAYDENDKGVLEPLAEIMGLSLKWVQDRVGMVTPRILFMIINEAYYTVQEGTADKAAIDTGMKLGTAYPFGPFEFVERIGIRDIYETLDALHKDTGDERYKICSMLKTEYLRREESGH